MARERLDYQELVREALRDVVRRSLEIVVEEGGLPGEHFFYISFRTAHPGVRIPPFLRDQYPDEVTIIIQHQFWDLEVDRDAFSVSLSFNASRQRVTVPYEALTSFVDPGAEFGLRFGPPELEAAEDEEEASEAEPASGPVAIEDGKPGKTGAPSGRFAEVIPFDPSRRR
ncbi:MAG TPA: ClpXP protease specificity-enhancing factor SspB [Thermoanaerobaculia bacterium]|nr:ClpXP protease specificity-enhancing factor SspB [Thermoanaerobaculia bacterium]